MTSDSDSLRPDLDGTLCSAAHCLAAADVVGTATVEIPAALGFTDDESTVVLEVPLCIDHGHRLRGGVTSCDFAAFPGL